MSVSARNVVRKVAGLLRLTMRQVTDAVLEDEATVTRLASSARPTGDDEHAEPAASH